MNTTQTTLITKPEDMAKSRAWAGQYLATAATLPISFVLDDKAISGIPPEWRPTSQRRNIDANICETVFEGNDPKTGLSVRVECTEYRDYPVVEWVAWFTNKGHETTPLIRDILAVDGMFHGSPPVLYHCNGDFSNEDQYRPEETPLQAGDTLAFAPNEGRPCDGAFPYYRIMFAEGGLSMAIGWPAQWAASFAGLTEGVHVRAGQEKTHLRLEPGETIRTPRMTLLFWAGDHARAVNLWRRWYLAHILPVPDGRPLKPLLTCAWPDEGVEFTAATEENQLRHIEKFIEHDIPFDVWWIDAGWYPCYEDNHERDWHVTGTWKPDPERFPKGLKPVSDSLAKSGAGLLLWFEPERVRPGTELETEHPEWLLRMQDNKNSLLNLGIPACRQWLTDRVCQLIEENDIKIYRQDFNIQPLPYWREHEAPDRQGMNENLHCQGYLKFWDDLLERNPGLWLDSCASGGRRNDFESMRRSVPLHYSDCGYGLPPEKLAFHRTMYEWIPYFKEDTRAWDIHRPTDYTESRFNDRIDSFSFHCGMAPMLFAALDIRRDDYDYALARKMISIWRKASNLLVYGDYYPHTPFHHSAAEWVAWQFDCPETGCGFIQGIRLPACPAETITIQPKAIHPDATYAFENAETGEAMDISGADLLREGFTLALPARSGAIWFYRRADRCST